MSNRILLGFCFVCLCVSGLAAAGKKPSAAGKLVEPRALELKQTDYKAAKIQAIQQRGIAIRRAPKAQPLVAEVRPDGSIVYRHRPLTAVDEMSPRKPQ